MVFQQLHLEFQRTDPEANIMKLVITVLPEINAVVTLWVY